MIDESIEAALRAGPPDERPHRQGALERGIAARSATGDRPPGFRVTVRSPGSPAPALLLAAAVAVVVIALIGGVLGSARPAPTLSPTSSPYPGATASPSGNLSPSRGAPAQLVDRWVGPVRPIPGLAKPPTRALLDILGVGFSFDAGPGQPNDLLASSVTQVGTDGLRLTALSPESCPVAL